MAFRFIVVGLKQIKYFVLQSSDTHFVTYTTNQTGNQTQKFDWNKFTHVVIQNNQAVKDDNDNPLLKIEIYLWLHNSKVYNGRRYCIILQSRSKCALCAIYNSKLLLFEKFQLYTEAWGGNSKKEI